MKLIQRERKYRRATNGQVTLIMVCAVTVISSIFLFSAVDVFRRNYEFKSFDFDQSLLNEVTLSSFSVAEAALERRLWEPPLDNDCLQAETFELKGSISGGITWKIKARYDFTTKNYELFAQGKYKKLTANFRKRIKVLDVSDYLLYSQSEQTVSMNRRYELSAPAALIGKDRRIYMRGKLNLNTGTLISSNTEQNWNGAPPNWPGDFGMIIQGERMQFAKGIELAIRTVERPNDTSSSIYNMLAPYSAPYGVPQPYIGQVGSGFAVFTQDFNLASTLLKQVKSESSGPLSYPSIAKQVYPIALFGGSPPLKAWEASDSGAFFNDVNRQSVFNYTYAGANTFGIRANFTCLAKYSSGESRCSDSERFPKGFSAWRQSAGLDGYLFTSDAEAVPAPVLSWEHFNSLEDDARRCGAVVEAPINSYIDCPIWDRNFLTRYASGTNPNCQEVSRIELDNINLNNFNPAVYSDVKNRERFSRRIIYLKTPAEIVQSNPRGLMMGKLSSPIARKNMPLWIVSEDMLALKGTQPDTTSPLDTRPGELREVFFNSDSIQKGTPSEAPPLSLVLFTPEQVHVLSPFYVPMSPSLLATSMPVAGGLIRPVRHNFTEFQRHENDGYRYGFRRFLIKNVSLVTGMNLPADQPFYMRGLWNGGSDSSARQYVINQCMVSLEGQQLEPSQGELITSTAKIPNYHAMANSPVPPPSSRFYYGQNYFAPIYYPAVFYAQQKQSSSRQESELDFTGLRIYTTFSPSAATGQRFLDKPLYNPSDNEISLVNLSHKVITWDRGVYYKDLPPQSPCIIENIVFRQHNSSSPTDTSALAVSMNAGRHILIQNFPDETYRQIGAVTGVEHPVVETQTEDF